MSTIDVNSVLSQIRALQSQARSPTAAIRPPELAAPGVAAAGSTKPEGFGTLLRQAVDGVAGNQNAAADAQKRFELGDPSLDLASVMLATSKSQVSFKAMVEVRNRLVSAYQDVMNMPL